MKRVLVIGNSQAAAFRQGWDSLRPQMADVELTFFTLPGTDYYQLQLDRENRVFGALATDKFLPRSLRFLNDFSGGPTISLEGFDDILVVGNQNGSSQVLSTLARFDIDDLREVGAPLRMSSAAFGALTDDLTKSLSPLDDWHALHDQTVIFVPPPLPAENAPELGNPDRFAKGTVAPLVRKPGGVKPAIEMLLTAFESRFAGANMRLARQPAETMGPSGLTLARFSRGAMGTRGKEIQDDYEHMNADYGASHLRTLLSA